MYYRCDVCGNEFTTEANLQRVHITITSAVRPSEQVVIYHEHACTDCALGLLKAANVDENGKTNIPRLVPHRHKLRVVE